MSKKRKVIHMLGREQIYTLLDLLSVEMEKTKSAPYWMHISHIYALLMEMKNEIS